MLARKRRGRFIYFFFILFLKKNFYVFIYLFIYFFVSKEAHIYISIVRQLEKITVEKRKRK